MGTLPILLIVLASLVFLGAIILAMKTAELSKAVSDNTTAINGVATSVDAAVAALGNIGAPSTPDADIIPLISALENNTQTAIAAKQRLDAALTPPTQG